MMTRAVGGSCWPPQRWRPNHSIADRSGQQLPSACRAPSCKGPRRKTGKAVRETGHSKVVTAKCTSIRSSAAGSTSGGSRTQALVPLSSGTHAAVEG